jgi:secondary thiamine-phosphate synthase enzyme
LKPPAAVVEESGRAKVVVQETFEIVTRGRGFESLTPKVAAVLAKSGITSGLCNVFTQHTSASLLITENADGAVRRDLERFMQRVAPDGSPDYEHDAEGPDDMPAHIRSVLTSATLTVPIASGELQLGTWQGIYLWEHRHTGHRRQIIVTITGER